MNIHDIERLGRELSVRSYLATVGAAGEPHVVPVHPGWEDTSICIMTGRTAVKTSNVRRDPRIAMHWEANAAGDGLLVWGTATVHTDLDTKARLWNEAFDYDLSAFAPDGPDTPDVVFISIEPTRAIHAMAYGSGGVDRWSHTPAPM